MNHIEEMLLDEKVKLAILEEKYKDEEGRLIKNYTINTLVALAGYMIPIFIIGNIYPIANVARTLSIGLVSIPVISSAILAYVKNKKNILFSEQKIILEENIRSLGLALEFDKKNKDKSCQIVCDEDPEKNKGIKPISRVEYSTDNKPKTRVKK